MWILGLKGLSNHNGNGSKSFTLKVNSCCFILRHSHPISFHLLQSNQVKCTPQESINKFIIQKLNPLLVNTVVDFRFISAFLYTCNEP